MTIPTHHFSSDRNPIGVERIVKRKTASNNEVHRHDFYELFLIHSGEGAHMIDLETHHFKAPSCHLVAPGQVHQLKRKAGSSGTVVMIAGDIDLGLANNNLHALFANAARCTDLSAIELKEANTLTNNIQENEDRIVQLSYLSILVSRCLTWFEATKQHTEKDLTAHFKALVEEGFVQDKQVSTYASKLNITTGHLNHLCKQKLGKTASAVIRGRLLLEAKRLLLHSEHSIKEIAYALELQDPAYFTRIFKNGTGSSPQVFRTQIREKYK